ncbi:hypothetical protein FOJ82_05980 [Tessaracoccus rhinocerotis]|uniref:Uncharacterized protein n=1 Tax=Tessaracoccus rhinocerotis TaxID=1689449 RepID=A0A553K1W0_9ACTN|nr:hypothetical protein [Tessaracoccus rhinocerotis]TRY18665.1 hypothetical protein FOJ82_05980 [Tessaracoccus rhinocerotis]
MVELTRTYPMPLHVMVLRYVTTLLVRTAAVCGALFLVVLVLGLALEEDALPVAPEVASGLDAFLRMFMGVVGLGGIFGVLAIAAIAHDLYRREQRSTLDALVDDGIAIKEWPPVRWQREAIGDSLRGTMILSFFGVVLGPIALLAGIFTFDGSDLGFSLGTLGVALVITAASVLGIRSALRKTTSSARTLWGEAWPELHRLEPGRKYSDGGLQTLNKRERARTARAKARLEAAPPELVRLDRIDGVAATVMNTAAVVLGLCAAVVALLTLVRKPCRNCEERSFGETTEGLIDVAILAGAVLLLVGLVVLVLGTALEGWVTLRLRSTVLGMAADPASEAPPWFLLRRLLLEETPLESLTGHLHTVGATCLAFGIVGTLTGDVYPFDEWSALFPVLNTIGSILLLFHASGWFWNREPTRLQNEALLVRWPE